MKWLSENKIIAAIVTVLLTVIVGAAYERGRYEEKNNCIQKYEETLKAEQSALVELTVLRATCPK